MHYDCCPLLGVQLIAKPPDPALTRQPFKVPCLKLCPTPRQHSMQSFRTFTRSSPAGLLGDDNFCRASALFQSTLPLCVCVCVCVAARQVPRAVDVLPCVCVCACVCVSARQVPRNVDMLPCMYYYVCVCVCLLAKFLGLLI